MITLAPVVAVTVPAMFLLEGAVAITPPTNVVESPVASPNVTVPVLRNVVVPAMLLTPPVIDTLYAPLAATVIPVVTVRLPANATVAAFSVSVIVNVLASTVLAKLVPPDCVMVN